MKIYVSLPISNCEDTLKERYHNAINFLKENYHNCTPVLPIDMMNLMYDNSYESCHSYSWFIGEDVKLVMDSDAILLTPGWENSKGCKIEKYVAEIMDKKIIIMN